MKEALNNAVEALKKKVVEARAELKCNLGETMAPRPAGYVEGDPLLGPCTDKWVPLVDKEDKAVDKILFEAVAADKESVPADKGLFTDDNVWVWGGPTPQWGGTTADDSLVKGADYFGAKNVVYMYGPTSKEMIQKHSKFKNVLCQVSNICRAPGAQPETDLENAEKLSKISLECPNVLGAMIDDMYNLIPEKKVGPIAEALRKHNKNLKLYGVVYKHNFDE